MASGYSTIGRALSALDVRLANRSRTRSARGNGRAGSAFSPVFAYSPGTPRPASRSFAEAIRTLIYSSRDWVLSGAPPEQNRKRFVPGGAESGDQGVHCVQSGTTRSRLFALVWEFAAEHREASAFTSSTDIHIIHSSTRTLRFLSPKRRPRGAPLMAAQWPRRQSEGS